MNKPGPVSNRLCFPGVPGVNGSSQREYPDTECKPEAKVQPPVLQLYSGHRSVSSMIFHKCDSKLWAGCTLVIGETADFLNPWAREVD